MAYQDRIPNVAKFCLGGLSGMSAVCFTHPLDLIKNRMQMSGELSFKRQYRTSFHALFAVLRQEGIFAVYRGLSGSLVRQSLYGTTRMGTYACLLEKFSSGGVPPSYSTKALCGIVAGVTSGLLSLPPDVVCVRMTLDGRLPLDQRRNYGNVATAFHRIARDEGVMALWRGAEPMVVRSIGAGVSLLATYSQAKQMLLDSGYFKENLLTCFVASLFSGLATAVVTVPADIAKTRIQNMQSVPGAPYYANTWDVWVKIIRHEGATSLWKGFGPYYARIAPQTVLLFVFMEEFCRLYAKHIMKSQAVVRVM